MIWIRSSQKAQVDAQAREEHVRRAELEPKALAATIGTRTLRTPALIQARVNKILAEQRVAGLLEPTVSVLTDVSHRSLRAGRPRPNDPVRAIRTKRPQLRVTRNTAALRAEARTDGVFPLVTNLTERSKREVLEISKYQPYIENYPRALHVGAGASDDRDAIIHQSPLALMRNVGSKPRCTQEGLQGEAWRGRGWAVVNRWAAMVISRQSGVP